jgi:hypothetical protein
MSNTPEQIGEKHDKINIIGTSQWSFYPHAPKNLSLKFLKYGSNGFQFPVVDN